MSNNSKMLSYPSLRVILSYFSFQKRNQLVRNVPSIRNMEKKVPFYIRKVQLTEDLAANCYRLWIDGMMIRFDYIENRRDLIRIIIVGRQIEDAPKAAICRCLEYYLNRENIFISQLTINKAAWPSTTFFPERVNSLKLFIRPSHDLERSLRSFGNRRFNRVIIENSHLTSRIFSLPMVYKAKTLLIKSVTLTTDGLLEMPLESNAVIRLKSYLNATFTDFCEKLLNEDELKVGTTFTVSYIGSSFNIKEIISFLERQTNSRKTNWNGRKSFTINLIDDDEKELVITWDTTGTFFEPKNHMTVTVLPKGSSTDREPTIVQNIVNVFNRFRTF